MEDDTASSAPVAEIRTAAVHAADMISAFCKEVLPDLLSSVISKYPGGTVANVTPQEPKPSWASHLRDCRNALKWDSSQTICHVGVGPALALAIVDTGSCKTIISKGMCDELGIQYQ
jgi:hypothetical protein